LVSTLTPIRHLYYRLYLFLRIWYHGSGSFDVFLKKQRNRTESGGCRMKGYRPVDGRKEETADEALAGRGKNDIYRVGRFQAKSGGRLSICG